VQTHNAGPAPLFITSRRAGAMQKPSSLALSGSGSLFSSSYHLARSPALLDIGRPPTPGGRPHWHVMLSCRGAAANAISPLARRADDSWTRLRASERANERERDMIECVVRGSSSPESSRLNESHADMPARSRYSNAQSSAPSADPAEDSNPTAAAPVVVCAALERVGP
jgi:hypothetical protein